MREVLMHSTSWWDYLPAMASSTNTNEGTINALKIPNLDLRSFCQDELHLTAYFSRPFSRATFADIVIPTVDKKLFNPSVGSRKQTYSRRSRGRPRAEQIISSSLSSQSRAGIQVTVAKQFKDSTAEIFANTSKRLLRSSLRNANKLTSSESSFGCLNHQASGGMVLCPAERLSFVTGSTPHTCEPENFLENRFFDGTLSGHTNITKLVVNSDTKRVEAPSEGEEVTLQQELEIASQAVGKDSGTGLETVTLQRPNKRMRIKEGARKRLVSEIIAEEGLMEHEISDATPLHLKGETRGKQSEVSKRFSIKLQDKRMEEEASLILDPVLQEFHQRGGNRLADISVESGKEGTNSEDQHLPSELGLLNDQRLPAELGLQTDQQLPAELGLQNDTKEINVKLNEKEGVMLECLSKMEGMWLSNETEKKVVDAKGFPKGWKVTIGLNRDNGQIFFEYHNYQSPDGKLWPSFKEASQYLLSEVTKFPIFSTVQSISLICLDQLDQAHVKGDVCETTTRTMSTTQTVSTSSDDVVLQNLQPGLTKHLQNKEVFRKVEKGISKPEVSRIYHTEEAEAESPLQGEPMEKDANRCSLLESELNVVSLGNEEYCVMHSNTSEQALSVDPQHLVGWSDTGCTLCKMVVDSVDICVCNWCENEFHVGCAEAASCCVNERSLLCPSCKAE